MRELNCKKHVLSLVIGALCASTGVASQAQSLTLEEVVVCRAWRKRRSRSIFSANSGD